MAGKQHQSRCVSGIPERLRKVKLNTTKTKILKPEKSWTPLRPTHAKAVGLIEGDITQVAPLPHLRPLVVLVPASFLLPPVLWRSEPCRLRRSHEHSDTFEKAASVSFSEMNQKSQSIHIFGYLTEFFVYFGVFKLRLNYPTLELS